MVRSLLLDRSRFCAEKLGDPVVDLNTTGPFAQAALPIGIKLDKIQLQLCAHPHPRPPRSASRDDPTPPKEDVAFLASRPPP